MQKGQIELHLTLRYQETSKDSNWSLTTVDIKSSELNIVKTYGGFNAQPNTSSEKKLTGADEQKIIDYLVKNELNVDLTEKKASGGIGLAVFLNLKITNPVKSEINLEGKYKIWGSDEYIAKEWGKEYVKSRSNIKNIRYVNKAASFISFLENL